MLDLDPYGGTDTLGMFNVFLKRTADAMAPRLSVVFLWIVRLGSFPSCWRQVNVTPIPKGLPSFSVANYRPTTLMVFVKSPGVIVTVAESLIRDLGRVSEWCDLWGM